MDKNTFRRNELLAQRVIKGLASRNMDGSYAASREEALRLALDLIPEGSSVTMGGGESPDVDIRIANDTWYPEESPSQQELIEGAENMATYNNIVDIVITHEPSAKVKEFLQMQFTEKSRVTLLNTYFEELAGAVDYRKWYFGSLHMDKHISGTQVAVFTDVLEAWTGKPI